jgi:hydroxymethylglutaryl-CoA lyase
VGIAQPSNIEYIFHHLIPEFKDVSIGAHFHSSPMSWKEKIQSAYDKGCLRFDSAMKGIGGCPMAEDELVGNIATENLVAWCDEKNIALQLNREALAESLAMAAQIFR